jgi:mRNA interferase RelE/StbE
VKSSFRASFQRDVKRIRDKRVLEGIRQAILNVEEADHWSKVPDIKKIQGSTNAFRIRISDHRIGLYIDGDSAEFVRVLPRRDIYRQFP